MRVNNHYLKESSTFKLKLDPALSRFVCIGLNHVLLMFVISIVSFGSENQT